MPVDQTEVGLQIQKGVAFHHHALRLARGGEVEVLGAHREAGLFVEVQFGDVVLKMLLTVRGMGGGDADATVCLNLKSCALACLHTGPAGTGEKGVKATGEAFGKDLNV